MQMYIYSKAFFLLNSDRKLVQGTSFKNFKSYLKENDNIETKLNSEEYNNILCFYITNSEHFENKIKNIYNYQGILSIIHKLRTTLYFSSYPKIIKFIRKMETLDDSTKANRPHLETPFYINKCDYSEISNKENII